MKLYTINKWDECFENNRSRELVNLKWVVLPNKHDGENFTSIITHKDGAEIFAAWVLLVQVASKCETRGTLLRGNGEPHTPVSLSIKTRAPSEWFSKCLDFLEKNTDWLSISQVDAGIPHDVTKKGREGKGIEKNGIVPSAAEILDFWNSTSLIKCLLVSDKRRRSLELRLKDTFFKENWKHAIEKISKSSFCAGESKSGWKATFDWFIQPDSVVKVVEGKYDNRQSSSEPKGHIP